MKQYASRTGFTLIELVMSLAIASVLAVAVTSAIYIATRSVPSRGDNLYTSTDLLVMDDTLRTELEMATAVLSVTNTSIEFEVPDRNSDTIPENIELGWSGVAGDPLRQRINGGAWSTVIAEVDDLVFTPTGGNTQTFAGSLTPVVTPTQIDGAFTDGGWSPIIPGYRTGFQIAPSLPNSTRWRLVGVDLYLRWRDSSAGDVLEISAGKAVTSITDPWKHSVVELVDGDISRSGDWIAVPLRTPWLAHDEKVNVHIFNKEGGSNPDFRIKLSTSMPQGLTYQYAIYDDWVLSPTVAISAKVRYETITADEEQTEVDTLAIDTIKVQMGFSDGISSTTMQARPLASAEDQR